MGPRSRIYGEKRVPAPVRIWGIWAMLGMGSGDSELGEDGFNQPGLIETKKKPKYSSNTPQSGFGKSRSFSSPWFRGILGSSGHKVGLWGNRAVPFSPAKPRDDPKTHPRKSPGRAERAPKGLRLCLSGTFWKGKTLWIRFNFPAMTWKGGENGGGERIQGYFPPTHTSLQLEGPAGNPRPPKFVVAFGTGIKTGLVLSPRGLCLVVTSAQRALAQGTGRPPHFAPPSPKGAVTWGVHLCHGVPGPDPALGVLRYGGAAPSVSGRGGSCTPKKRIAPQAAVFPGGGGM